MSETTIQQDTDAPGNDHRAAMFRGNLRHYALLALLLLATLGIRLIFSLQVQSPPVSDSAGYDVQARHIALENRLYGDEKHQTYHPPGYAFALGMIYKAVGPGNYAAVRIVQCLLGLLAGFLVYDIVRVLAGRTAGLFALAGFALISSNVFVSGLLLTENTFIPLSLLFLRLVVIPADHQRIWYLIPAGVVGAAAVLTRPEFLPMVALTGVAITLREGPRKWRRHIKPAFVLVLTAALCTCAWTVRNAVKYRAFVPVATCWGRTIYETNKPPYYPDVKTFRAQHTQNLTEVEEDWCFRGAINRAFKNHTQFYATKYYFYKQWRALRHLFLDNRLWFPLPEGKALLGMEYPPSTGTFGFKPVSLLHWGLARIPLLNLQALLIVLAAGLLFCRFTDYRVVLLAGYLLIGHAWMSTVLYPQELRFRVTYEPVVLILGVVGLVNAMDVLRKRPWQPVLCGAIMALLPLVFLSPPVYRIFTAYFDAKTTVETINRDGAPGDAVFVADGLSSDFNWYFAKTPGIMVGHEAGITMASKDGRVMLDTLQPASRRIWMVLKTGAHRNDEYLHHVQQRFPKILKSGREPHVEWYLLAPGEEPAGQTSTPRATP